MQCFQSFAPCGFLCTCVYLIRARSPFSPFGRMGVPWLAAVALLLVAVAQRPPQNSLCFCRWDLGAASWSNAQPPCAYTRFVAEVIIECATAFHCQPEAPLGWPRRICCNAYDHNQSVCRYVSAAIGWCVVVDMLRLPTVPGWWRAVV